MDKSRHSRRHQKRQPNQPEASQQVPDAGNPDPASAAGIGRSSCTFKLESLEPRILLSGTWVGTEGDDNHDAGNGETELSGLGGNDILHGGNHSDTLLGGEGNDTLFGENHDDVLDGGAGDDSLFGGLHNDVLISGGGNDYLDGGMHDDTFRFTGAQNGDVVTVDGGHGSDTIDLSEYAANQVSNDGSTIQVDLGGGQSFTIHHSNVEHVLTGDAANEAPTALAGSVTMNEDASAAIHLTGSDPDAGDAVAQYRIDALPDHGTLQLGGNAVSAGTVVTQAQIDNGELSFTPDAQWHGSTQLTFSVHDGDAWSDQAATFDINVNAVNDAPAVSGGLAPIEALENELVQLSVTADDADGDQLAYQWTQLDGPAVTLSDGNAADPSFTSPHVTTPTTLTFEVTVSDGFSSAVNTVQVTVNPDPQDVVVTAPPVQPVPVQQSAPEAPSATIIDAPLSEADEAPVIDNQITNGPDTSAGDSAGQHADENNHPDRVDTLNNGSNPKFIRDGELPHGDLDQIPVSDNEAEAVGSSDEDPDQVVWDEDSDLQVLNPLDATSQELTLAPDLDGLQVGALAEIELDNIQNILSRDFHVAGEFVLPEQRSLTDAIDALIASVGQGTAREAFVEVPLAPPISVTANSDTSDLVAGEEDRADHEFHQRRFDDVEGSTRRGTFVDPASSVIYDATTRDRTTRLTAEDQPSNGVHQPERAGFFARVWGAISALGSRSDDKEKT